jgi:hypothetical protein
MYRWAEGLEQQGGTRQSLRSEEFENDNTSRQDMGRLEGVQRQAVVRRS